MLKCECTNIVISFSNSDKNCQCVSSKNIFIIKITKIIYYMLSLIHILILLIFWQQQGNGDMEGGTQDNPSGSNTVLPQGYK